MQTKSKLMLAVLAALAIGATSAFAATEQLARHGQGRDDLAPPPACDDHAIDGFCGAVAKNGADDVLPEGLDNNGVDFVIGKNGADDVLPEGLDNNGVDFIIGKNGADDVLPEGLDNNGVDFVIGKNGADDVLPEGLDNNGVDFIAG